MAPKNCAMSGSNLVAVLLITRSKPGPRLVFHYPEVPGTRARPFKDNDADSDASDSESDDEEEDSEKAPTRHGDTLLGHSVDSLEKVLGPNSWRDGKQKFEITLNNLTYIGRPVYAPEDGNWSGKATSPQQPQEKRSVTKAYGEYHMYLDPASLGSTPPLRLSNDFKHVPESLESRGHAASMESGSTTSGVVAEVMGMFHVVFVLHSGSGEAVRTIYREVARKLSRALHYCQMQSGYVGVESRKLFALKAMLKQQQQTPGGDKGLWQQMIETSELAWALKETFEQISKGEVATIRLNGMEMSMQATQQVTNDDDSHQDQEGRGRLGLEPLSAILLLETKESLLHQLSHPDASPLAQFIRGHTPTKSLQKVAHNLGIPVNEILYLAHHLLKWRKALLIRPFHQRNFYTIAPAAPLDDLTALTAKYTAAFPTLPSLPNMLKVLSGKPIKYGMLIPSRDHRNAYMEILSFLVREELIIHMRTYGWLKLPKNPHPHSKQPARPMTARSSLLSPHLRPATAMSDMDEVESISSDKTAIITRHHHQHRSSFSKPHKPVIDPPADEKSYKILKNPLQPVDAEEANLLSNLKDSLPDDAELKENFPILLKHLDGQHAFEEIGAKEGLKRARVEAWLGELEDRGLLLTVRHI